jgi:hypothetical protein
MGWQAPEHRACAPRFGQVNLDKSSEAPCQPSEWMRGLHDARALGPAASRAGREGDNRDLAARDGCRARALGSVADVAAAHDIPRLDVLYQNISRQSVLGETDAPCLEIGANSLVLRSIESAALQQLMQ